MKEEAGPKTGSVRLVNTGPEEAVITGARPSCGCTGVAYPDDPIAPGDTVKFSFTYNPLGRPGKIREIDTCIYRRFRHGDNPHTRQCARHPRIPLDTLSGGSGTVAPIRKENGGRRSDLWQNTPFFLNGYNQTADTIRPSWSPTIRRSACRHHPKPLWSGRHRDSQFLFQLTPENRDGTLGNPGANHFRQQTGAPETEVLFTADLHPDFSSMTPEEVNDAPRCYAAPDRIDLGTLVSSAGKPVGFRFAIRNEGKAEMRINRIFFAIRSHKDNTATHRNKGGKSAETEGLLDFSSLPQEHSILR